MSKINFYEAAVLDAALHDQSVWIALFTADPTETGDQTSEVSGGSYARVEVADIGGDQWTDDGQVSDSLQYSNTSAITFPKATASWGTVTHFAVMDAVTTGNMRYFAALAASKAVGDGDTASFAAGGLKVQEN